MTVRLIPLHGQRGEGLCAVVDSDVVLPTDNWYVAHNGYVVSNFRDHGRRHTRYLHRFVAATPDGMDTDHINRDRLDNRRANLRHATRNQNNANVTQRGHSAQPYKGVRPSGAKWQARITVDRRECYLGTFDTPEDAAMAYDAAAAEYFGTFAVKNGVRT